MLHWSHHIPLGARAPTPPPQPHACPATILLKRASFLQKLMPSHMPFGLSLAPWAFTRIMRPIMREIHKKGIMSFCLLDDFLLTDISPIKLTQKSKELLKLLQELGIQVTGKSVLMPRQN